MNERIRKLAIKSGIDIRGHLSGVLTLDEKPGVNDLVKFAELIVRECAGHIDDLITCDDDGNQILDCDDVRTELLEHFGVD